MLLALCDEVLVFILRLSTIQDCKNVSLCCRNLREISLDVLYTKVTVTGKNGLIRFATFIPTHRTTSLTVRDGILDIPSIHALQLFVQIEELTLTRSLLLQTNGLATSLTMLDIYMACSCNATAVQTLLQVTTRLSKLTLRNIGKS